MTIFENEIANYLVIGLTIFVLVVVGTIVGLYLNEPDGTYLAPESIALDAVHEDINSLRKTFIDLERVIISIPDGSTVNTTKAQILVDILSSQIRQERAIILNSLGERGCWISNEFSIDANTLGVSLICPIGT